MYNKFLQWQKFFDAEEMVNEKEKESFEDKWKNIRYTDIVINKVTPEKDNKKISVIITRKYYTQSNPVLHSERVKQIWKYKGEKWVLESEEVLKKD